MHKYLVLFVVLFIFSCTEQNSPGNDGSSANPDDFKEVIQKYENTVTEKPKEVVDKFMYVNGYRMALNMMRDSLHFDIEQFIQGFIDGIKNKDTKVPIDSMDQVMADFGIYMTKRTEERAKLQSIEISVQQVVNLAEADSFLVENAKKTGVVSLPSGLQYKIIKEGTGRMPTPTDPVLVHMTSTFPDGTIFDDTRKGDPRAIPNERMIPGWLEGITKMKEGSRWILYMHPNLAFGEFGMEGKVPPNKLTIVDVELIKIMSQAEVEEHLKKNPPKPMIPGGPVKGM